jgi:hypothetical protein
MKEIGLTQGMVALVDDGDYEWLNQWKWYAGKLGNGYYASRHNGQPVVLMHRQILGLVPGDGKIADHENRDSLDNRRKNLRVVSKSKNCLNHNGHIDNTSGHTGVSWHKPRKKWQAYIRVNGKTVYLGVYKKIEDAVRSRVLAEEVYYSGP